MSDEPESEDLEHQAREQPAALQNIGTDAAHVESARDREDKQLGERAEHVRFWKGVLADPVGRKVVWGLLTTNLHAFENRFTGTGEFSFPNPDAREYERALQDFGTALHRSLLSLDPEGVIAMHKEHDTLFQAPAKATRRRRKSDR